MIEDLEVERILIPVDFSDSSRKAFYVGVKLATKLNADAHILHVEGPLHTMTDPVAVSEEVERLEDGVQRRLNALYERGGLEEVDRRRVFVEIRGGKPWMEICRYAEEANIGLIVMVTEGLSGVKHAIKGSTAERVVNRAACPVLTVKPDGYESNIEGIPKKFRQT